MPSRFHLDPHLPEPIYRQLMDQVRRLIVAGQLRAGDELPSVRAIAATHAVNPMTISKAYSLLEAEGVLQRNRGAAMSVADGADAGNEQAIDLLAPALDRVVKEAAQLGLTQAQVVAALRKRMGGTK
ncbi:GntR family transcriptional regulator [Uliginosibacterium sp. H1]|uniref:GntR family transcriptional regulator n=1 Tax=Uliginosibacterium sp. H1 TaxID=3114757 RepID=UPI002E1866BA|nr:GntR family transcriptional regulator [Uliginosibacterium sp. H1]